MDWRKWARATLICATLDLLYALMASALTTKTMPGDVLRAVASGPFGDAAADWGISGALLGLSTHYGLMAAMAGAGLVILSRPPFSELPWWKTGAFYGIVVYLVMHGIVLPWRFDVPFPNPDKLQVAIWFAPHILFVGWPLALIAQGRLFSAGPRSS